MRFPSLFSSQRWAVLLLGCAFVISFTHACGGKVVVDTGALPGTGGTGGLGGAGGGFSDACELFGPVTPDGCKTNGASCFYADTSCAQSWTCLSGIWSQGTGCFNQSTAVAVGAGGGG